MVDRSYWILKEEEYEKLLDEYVKGLREDLLAQWKKGANKRGNLDLFSDERIFGSIPRGSEAYMEVVDVQNYAGIIGPEQTRRKDAILKKG
jgi:hypothetical protein